ncbi:hypothetical protein PR048_032909 [Dryococelus australis]|uniref:Uncharacterized protein n=1 Tax=Dryococelus australis TaxID=614101 RepID=A0ABQ9G4R0_9NEOP|nr:hypothetical protein PR048_032909 [Dryococelus australis]
MKMFGRPRTPDAHSSKNGIIHEQHAAQSINDCKIAGQEACQPIGNLPQHAVANQTQARASRSQSVSGHNHIEETATPFRIWMDLVEFSPLRRPLTSCDTRSSLTSPSTAGVPPQQLPATKLLRRRPSKSASGQCWAALNIEVSRADDGESSNVKVKRFGQWAQLSCRITTSNREKRLCAPVNMSLAVARCLRHVFIHPAHSELNKCIDGWATVSERLPCSPPTKAIRVQSPAGSPRVFVCDNRVGRCRCSAGFIGDLLISPPFHSGGAPYPPQSPSSALKTSMQGATSLADGQPIISVKRSGLLLTAWSREPTRVIEYGASPGCKDGGNGKSSREPAAHFTLVFSGSKFVPSSKGYFLFALVGSEDRCVTTFSILSNPHLFSPASWRLQRECERGNRGRAAGDDALLAASRRKSTGWQIAERLVQEAAKREYTHTGDLESPGLAARMRASVLLTVANRPCVLLQLTEAKQHELQQFTTHGTTSKQHMGEPISAWYPSSKEAVSRLYIGEHPLPSHSLVFASGNPAGRCRWSAGFCLGSPIAPALSFRRCSILTSIALIGSQDFAVKSHPSLVTHNRGHVAHFMVVAVHNRGSVAVILGCLPFSLDRCMNNMVRPAAVLILHKAEEHTSCIHLDLKQGFQKCSFYREQFMTPSKQNVVNCLREARSTQAWRTYNNSTIAKLELPTRVIEVRMEHRRNEMAGETGDPRENLSTGVLFQHDSHMRKPGSDPAGE